MSKSDFTPDKDNLDEEWVRQPELYHEYATQLADARLEQSEAQNKLEIVTANLDAEIRSDPESYGLAKITDAVVKATIPSQPEHKKATQKVQKARHRVDVLQAAVAALDHKKKALENLVYLHGQNYFSSPHAKGMDGEEIDRAARRAKSKKDKGFTREDLREED